jgi:hypothetical protein
VITAYDARRLADDPTQSDLVRDVANRCAALYAGYCNRLAKGFAESGMGSRDWYEGRLADRRAELERLTNA